MLQLHITGSPALGQGNSEQEWEVYGLVPFLVEAPSLSAEPQSASARNKMWTGVMGILLGLVFLVPGVALYLKSQRGDDGSVGT